MTEIERIGPDSPIIQIKTPDHSPSSSISSQKFDTYYDGKYSKVYESKIIFLGELLCVKHTYCYPKKRYIFHF